MSAVERGIVLDAETAAVVRGGARCERQGRIFFHGTTLGDAHANDVLTHIGGRPVAELVAAHDEAKAHAERLNTLAAYAQLRAMEGDREVWEVALAAADFLDRCADLLIAPALVAAWHTQHDGSES